MELLERVDPRGVGSVVSVIDRSVRHRATTSTGAVVDDPSPADLAALLAEVGRSGRGAFVIVERRTVRSPRRGEYYLQAVRQGAGWVVEVRAGGPERQFRAAVDDSQVGEAFGSWMKNWTRWPDLAWQHVARASSWELTAGLAGAV